MAIISPLPNNIMNGQPLDAVPVMANFNEIFNDVNLNGAHNGANSDITSILGLTTPLSAPQGGTGLGAYAIGDLLYASAANALARLPDVAAGKFLASGGVGVAPAWANASGRLLAVTTFLTAGTFTHTPNTLATNLLIEAVGGGGAGGGAPATGGGQGSVGGGGGPGFFGRAYIAASGAQTVVIGAAGVGVSGATGGNGGDTSYAGTIIWKGGTGGLAGGPANIAGGNPGGTSAGSTGQFWGVSGNGLTGFVAINTVPLGVGGAGGNVNGTGGGAGAVNGGGSVNGSAALGYGCGGAGGISIISNPAATGGAGFRGYMVIYELA